MAIWDTLGKLAEGVGLVEKVDSVQPPPNVESSTPSSPPPASTAAKRQPSIAPVVSTEARPDLDEKARAILIQAMRHGDAPLVEKFADSLDTLKDAIPDETARYSTSLKLMSKQGHSSLDILGDYDKTLGVLESSKRAFEADTIQVFNKKVGSKTALVERLEADIAVKQQQLTTLQAEIASLVTQKRDESAGIQVEKDQISQVQGRFVVVYESIRSDFKTIRDKIAKYSEGN